MCGIIGATGVTREALQEGLQTFSYRGPDALGYSEIEGMLMGHARLSIIDLDPRSNQPFWDERKERAIVFNGEIYNFREIRAELEKYGVIFRTESDTEVLLAAFGQWGKDMLPRLRGMFAFAIQDAHAGTVFLARDHAGIKPLYYTLEGGLVFASELKGVVSLMRARTQHVELDTASLGLYRAFGYVPSPHTLVSGLRKLERGSWLSYDIATATADTGSWQPETTAVDTVVGLEAAVRESVLEHTIADVPVGLFFSGGIDSSVIALVLQEAGMKLETFSIGVEGRGADEPYFNAIAKELHVSAHAAPFGIREAEEMYEHVFSKMDDPIADSSILPTAYVSRLAHERVTVVLSGEGGDELFQGYPRQEAIVAMGTGARSRLLDAFLTAGPAFKGKRRLLLGLARAMHDPAFYYLLTVSLAQDMLEPPSWERARDMLAKTEPLWFDRDWYLENMLLRKADMATMYSSLEGRVPLLGAQVWNAAPKLSRENLAGGTKMVLRNMLKKRLPAELVDRPKSGFGISTRQLFAEFEPARTDLSRALAGLQEHGFPAPARQGTLVKNYPAYAFGIVALYRSLQNLSLL